MVHLLGGVSPDEQPISDKPTNWQFDFVREIGQQEYDAVLQARVCLHQFQREISLYNIFISSYEELKSFSESATQHLLYRDSSIDMDNVIEGMDARLMALFSHFKTFLEYWKEKFKAINRTYYSSASQRHLRNNKSYRICYHLRNYAQHYGSPLVNCVIKSSPRLVDIHFSMSKQNVLQASLRHWDTKQADLHEEPNQIRLEPYLEELRNCVKQMHTDFIRYDSETVLSYFSTLSRLYAEVQAAFPNTYPWVLSRDSGGVTLQIIDVPLRHLETVRMAQVILDAPQ